MDKTGTNVIKGFYTTELGKEKPFAFTNEGYKEYENVCGKIWGGLPLDLTWSMNTEIYKEALQHHNSTFPPQR